MFCNHGIFGPFAVNREDNHPDHADAKTVTNVDTFCTYATLQEILLRTCTPKKVKFLFNLFKEIGAHNYMQIMFRILHTYFTGKLSKYLVTLDQSSYINDINMPDNNRTMDAKELNQCFQQIILWFRYLDDADLKMGIFLSLLTLCGNSTIYKLLVHMKSFYKNEPSLNKPQDTSLTISEDLQGDGYVEKLDETDPDAQVIIRKRKEWQDNINKYRSKVEESLGLPANTTSKRSVTIQKGKQKSKTSLKTSTDIDIIQLMPIWIVMKIFSYLDAKVLRDIKRVNAYWDFVCTHLAEEEKGRKMFDKWIDSIKAEYHVTSITLYPENVRPYYRFTAPVNPLSCDMKVYNTLKKRNTIKPFNISLISAMANDETSLFYPPLLNLQPFQRNVKAQMDANDKEYLHNRAPCTYVDKHKINLIPIKDLPTIGDFIPHVTLNEETKSFIFVPSTEKLDVTSDQAVHMQYSVFSSVNWNSVGKHLEFDEKLSDLMAKSIAHYVAKVTSSVISKEYKEKLIEKHESRNN